MKTARFRDKKNIGALQAAEEVKTAKAEARKKQKLELVAKLWHQLKTQGGAEAMHKDTNAARAICMKAQKPITQSCKLKKQAYWKDPMWSSAYCQNSENKEKLGKNSVIAKVGK